MDKIEIIKGLEDLKEHFISVQEIYDCSDYKSHIETIDAAVGLIANMGES